MSEQPGRYQRSFAGMIGAMIVLIAVVAVFVVFRDAVRNDPANPVQPIDYDTSADYARSQADFELLAPDELPEGWIATSVRFDVRGRQAWHLGVLTDQERYVGLEQAERPISAMVEEHVDEDAAQGEDVTVDGESWQTWTDSGDDLALVRDSGDATTLVVGRVPQETLEEFLATLR